VLDDAHQNALKNLV